LRFRCNATFEQSGLSTFLLGATSFDDGIPISILAGWFFSHAHSPTSWVMLWVLEKASGDRSAILKFTTCWTSSSTLATLGSGSGTNGEGLPFNSISLTSLNIVSFAFLEPASVSECPSPGKIVSSNKQSANLARNVLPVVRSKDLISDSDSYPKYTIK
jgi:hypothetical protein